jgi:hypothetical protein
MQTPENVRPITQNDALTQIEFYRSMVLPMGANDKENDEFNEIRNLLTGGDITPDIAIQKAEALAKKKQENDYH